VKHDPLGVPVFEEVVDDAPLPYEEMPDDLRKEFEAVTLTCHRWAGEETVDALEQSGAAWRTSGTHALIQVRQ
jgi:hypothetical protein